MIFAHRRLGTALASNAVKTARGSLPFLCINSGRLALIVLGAIYLALGAGPASAQNYPNRPIKFVVGYTPGGSNDILGRMFAQKLSERIGQPVVVENKPGADSIIGTDFVAKSPPDGYTLLVSSAAMILNAALYEKVPYDTGKDFFPVTMFASDPLVYAVNPSVQANTIAELIALAKAKPAQLFYSSGAPAFHVSAEWFKHAAGVNIVHVPYKGSVPAITAAISGEVPMVVISIVPVIQHLRSGKLRPLVVTSEHRDALLPQVPTMKESGLDVEGGIWVGLFAPAATPRPVVDKLYAELAVILKSEATLKGLTTLGYDTSGTGMSPSEFGKFFNTSLRKWTKVINDVKIQKSQLGK